VQHNPDDAPSPLTPLDEIVQAYQCVETQQKIGNVVITVAYDGDRDR
jgi:hypothetical protein